MWQTLTQPLNPRAELWVRRVFGAAQAALAVLAAASAISLAIGLYLDESSSRLPRGHRAFDPHGFGFMALVAMLVPTTVVLAFGSASVWRKWSVPWWLPLLTIVGVDGVAWLLLP